MTPEEKAEIKRTIQNAIEAVISDIADLEKRTKPIPPDNAIGRLTRLDAINNRSVNEASLRTARVKLRRLEEMRIHVDKSDFGQCAVCHAPIPVERLMLIPESDRCVKCAS